LRRAGYGPAQRTGGGDWMVASVRALILHPLEPGTAGRLVGLARWLYGSAAQWGDFGATAEMRFAGFPQAYAIGAGSRRGRGVFGSAFRRGDSVSLETKLSVVCLLLLTAGCCAETDVPLRSPSRSRRARMAGRSRRTGLEEILRTPFHRFLGSFR